MSKKKWNSPIYAFFKPNPSIEYKDRQRSHVFQCNAKGCTKGICQFLDKGDALSTGNMRKHIKTCWGKEILDQVMQTKSFNAARDAVKNYQSNGTITTTFEQKDAMKKSYSHLPHTKIQMR